MTSEKYLSLESLLIELPVTVNDEDGTLPISVLFTIIERIKSVYIEGYDFDVEELYTSLEYLNISTGKPLRMRSLDLMPLTVGYMILEYQS